MYQSKSQSRYFDQTVKASPARLKTSSGSSSYSHIVQFILTDLTTVVQFNRSSKYQDRYVFAIGDYIQFHETHFGRVENIMLFDCVGVYRHIFIQVTELKRTGTRDSILDLEIMEELPQQLIIGVPAVKPVRPYMVSVAGVGIVWNDWNVYFM